MDDSMLNKVIKLMVTIVDREKGVNVVDLYRAQNLHFNYVCLAKGTANSKILDYFGLSETEKDFVITMIPAFKVGEVMHAAQEKFSLKKAGSGIMFTIPLSGVSGQIPQILCKPEYLEMFKQRLSQLDESDVRKMIEAEKAIKSEKEVQHDLVLSIVNRDFTDTVMDAAKAAGATGGTVINARRVGFEDIANIWGFTIQPEKEIVAILVPRPLKNGIMQEINRKAGLTTDSHGILFSLPVEDMIGLHNSNAFKEGKGTE